MTNKTNRLNSGRPLRRLLSGVVPGILAAAVVWGAGNKEATAAVPGWDSERTQFFATGVIQGDRNPTWSDKTGTASIYWDCWERRSGPTYTELSCLQVVDNGYNLYPNAILQCTAEMPSGVSKNVDVTGTTTIGAWTINVTNYYDEISASNKLRDFYGSRLQQKFSVGPKFKATYSTTGVAVEKLTISCLNNDPYSWDHFKGNVKGPLSMVFQPPAVATFSVNGSTTGATSDAGSHRTKDAGLHTFNLDFGQTIAYSSRTLGISVKTTDESCKFVETTGTLEYSNKSVSFNPSTGTTPKTVNLFTDAPSTAVLKLKTKRSKAGSYSCNVTLTQTVL